MAANREAVVGSENDQGVVILTARLQGSEDPANLGVEELDRGVIVGQILADEFRGSRPGGQSLVADGHLAVIEGVLREEVCGERGLRLVGPSVVLGWRHPGIVREVERDVAKERSSARLGLEKLRGGIGEQLDRMLAADPLVDERVLGRDVLDREVVRVAHPTKEDGLASLKDSQC